MSKITPERERMLLLRYACERIARSIYKGGWRHRARLMERAALWEAVCSVRASREMQTIRDANMSINETGEPK